MILLSARGSKGSKPHLSGLALRPSVRQLKKQVRPCACYMLARGMISIISKRGGTPRNPAVLPVVIPGSPQSNSGLPELDDYQCPGASPRNNERFAGRTVSG